MLLSRLPAFLYAPPGDPPSPFATPPAPQVAQPAAPTFAEPVAPLPPIAIEAAPAVVAEPIAPPVATEVAIVPVEPTITQPVVAAPAISPEAAQLQQETERSLLAGAKSRAEVKATVVAAPVTPAPVAVETAPAPAIDAKVGSPPPAPVKYQAFKLPEGVTFEETKLKEKLLDHVAPDQVPQEVVQKLVDNLVEEIQRVVTEERGASKKYFNGLRAKWKSEWLNDPQLANRSDTALQNGKALIETYAPPEDRALIFQQLDINGMSDFPPYLRFVDKVGQALNVFEDGIVTPAAPPPQPKNGRGWYDKSPTANQRA